MNRPFVRQCPIVSHPGWDTRFGGSGSGERDTGRFKSCPTCPTPSPTHRVCACAHPRASAIVSSRGGTRGTPGFAPKKQQGETFYPLNRCPTLAVWRFGGRTAVMDGSTRERNVPSPGWDKTPGGWDTSSDLQ